MKKWLIQFLLGSVLGVVGIAGGWAAQANLQWDYGQTTGFSGFKGYCSATSGTWPATASFTTGPTVKTAQVTYTGRVYCVVRAFDATGESADSNVLTFIERPTNLREASQSVSFDPSRERVAMRARIVDKETGEVLSEVTAQAGN